MTRNLILFYIILGIAYNSNSQNFQWIKQIGDKHIENGSRCKILQDGRSIVSWYFGDSSKIDAFKLKFKKSSVPSVISFLSKDGKAKWVWTPDSSSNYCIVSNICYSESLSKIFICGNFKKKVTINNITYKGEENGFIIRLDTNGTFEKIYTLSGSDISFETMEITEKNEIIMGVNMYYFNSQISIPEIGFLMMKPGYFILKLDKDLVPKKASEPAYGLRWGRLAMSLSSSNTILNTYSFHDTAVIDGKIYFNGTGATSTFITYLDSNLKVKKNVLLIISKGSRNNYVTINSIKSLNDGSIVIAGRYEDSISLIPKKYYDNHVPLFACLDSNLKLKWYKSPEVKIGERISGEILDMNISGDYIYAGGLFFGNTVYREFNLPQEEGTFWFFKTDKLGNILWMNKIGVSNYFKAVTSISANNQREILLSGVINDTIKLNNQIYITAKSKTDVLLMKINDIDIIRGYVKSGPYCAGDTIQIPYTKNGTFNKGNQFIAQLSDAEGNFEGKERELGRITSDTDGVIKGLLPLFDVESSPFYRIRILSTSPVVQSYYKYDTLRLLIYSKDTANAGKDTIICPGQTVKITTTGGSRWRWSPGNLVKDSTAKTTAAIPLVTTKYRIIISDSSGCGKIDTAYKTITVRPPLNITGLPKDTIVCKDSRVLLKLTPSGGLGKDYSYQWLSAFNKPLGNADTFSIKVTEQGSIKVVLGDGCSLKKDTQVINFKFPDFKFTQLLKDSLVCRNTPILLRMTPSSGVKNEYNYKWLTPANALLRSTDTLTYKVSKKDSLKMVLTYKCSGKSDTSFVRFSFPKVTFNQLLKDTLVCKNSEPLLKLIPSIGKSSDYSYQWFSDFKPLAATDTMRYKITQAETLKAILTYNCSGKRDTSFIKLNIPPAIQAKIEKPICFDSSLTLKINGTGGYKNSLSHVWYKDGKAINLGKTIDLSGINKKQWIIASTTDFCNTKVKDSVLLFPNPKANLISNVDSVCQYSPIIISNLSKSFAPINTGLSWLSNQSTWKNKDTTLTFNETGKKTISIKVTDSIGCMANASINIEVIEKPNAGFVTKPENPTVDNGTLELIPVQAGYKKYRWDIGGLIVNNNKWQSVRLPISDTISYLTTLMVSNAFGCRDTLTKTIRVGVSDAFFIPNAVSRNDDGLNDEFAPYGWKVQSYDMLIVARTSQIVFKGSTPWKPTFEDGVYSYVMKVKFKDGSENTFKGHVHVIH